MSLIKQLWIATILLVVIVFSGSLATSIASSRGYLLEQLNEKNIDNATSLALTMSHMEKDMVNIELLLSAQFDSGHYQLIRLTDPDGNVLLERKKESNHIKAPGWFIRLLAMEIQPGYAQVQDNWSQFGRIHIESDARFAYEDLWRGSQKMLLVSLLIGLISAFVGSLVLKRLLRPLNEVVQQAEAIGERRFITSSEPATTEFKILVQAMNRMTTRIRNMLQEESQRLEKLRLEANYDSTSGLMNRQYFFNRVHTLTSQEEDFVEGMLVIVRLHDLSYIDKTLGHNETNALLLRVGKVLEAFSEKDGDAIAGRLSGTDFAVFSSTSTDCFAFASNIKGLLMKAAGSQQTLPDFKLPTVCAKFSRGDSIETLYQAISEVTSEISRNNPDMLHVLDANDIKQRQDTDETEWQALLSNALKAKRLKLAHFPVIGANGKIIHQESPVRMQLRDDNNWLPAGEFISWANRLGLVCRIDVMVIEKALEELSAGGEDIGLNISTRAICDKAFVKQVAALISARPECAQRLWLEVPERGAFEYLDEFRAFCNTLKPLGCKIGIEHVGAYISRLGELHDLGLDYIKIDVSVINGIDSNTGNQAFFRGLCLIAHTIGLIAIAEGVQTQAEMDQLLALGVDGMTGPAIRMD
ncbi:MAG: GGDEF domain-containing protein [Betaproteobacteria bacterium HGW-Betaproteobacteria-8]|nr:MAG: GGDEF domain-containing protein [Betaproteobacteria bacterium HGW-Betaproteobacteria-8]